MRHQHIKKLGLGLSICTLPFCTQAQTLYNNGAVLYLNTGASMQVNGGMNNASGSDLNNNGTLSVTGTLTNNQSMATAHNGTLRLNGTSAQILSGSSPLLVKDVIINNAAGITLNAPLTISGQCTFTNGILTASTAGNALTFTATSNFAGASNSSHINGYAVREGTGNFSFPIGDGTKLQVIAVTLSSNADGMRARYSPADAGTAPFGTTGTETAALTGYNDQEYWDLSPISSATGTVTLIWDGINNGTINNISELRVAHRSGGSWLNEGTNNLTGSTSFGTITSNSLSSWSPFTLGIKTTPLPVTLLRFYAKEQGTANVLQWTTTMESPAIQYYLERSSDAEHFQPLGMIAGKEGNDNAYQYVDTRPLPLSYYRLRITEPGAAASYSSIVRIRRTQDDVSVAISPVPAQESLSIVHSYAELNGQEAWITDIQGRIVQRFILQDQVQLSVRQWPAGIYILHLPNGVSAKLIKE